MSDGQPVLDRAFEDIKLGETATLERLITEDMIESFASLSGDRNPLHMDDTFAAASALGRRIAHGHLVAAPLSALAGHLLPGKRCLILEIRFRFVSPVHIDDHLVYRGTVAHVAPAVRALKVDVEVTKSGGQTVLRGSYQCQVLDPP